MLKGRKTSMPKARLRNRSRIRWFCFFKFPLLRIIVLYLLPMCSLLFDEDVVKPRTLGCAVTSQ